MGDIKSVIGFYLSVLGYFFLFNWVIYLYLKLLRWLWYNYQQSNFFKTDNHKFIKLLVRLLVPMIKF